MRRETKHSRRDSVRTKRKSFTDSTLQEHHMWSLSGSAQAALEAACIDGDVILACSDGTSLPAHSQLLSLSSPVLQDRLNDLFSKQHPSVDHDGVPVDRNGVPVDRNAVPKLQMQESSTQLVVLLEAVYLPASVMTKCEVTNLEYAYILSDLASKYGMKRVLKLVGDCVVSVAADWTISSQVPLSCTATWFASPTSPTQSTPNPTTSSFDCITLDPLQLSSPRNLLRLLNLVHATRHATAIKHLHSLLDQNYHLLHHMFALSPLCPPAFKPSDPTYTFTDISQDTGLAILRCCAQHLPSRSSSPATASTTTPSPSPPISPSPVPAAAGGTTTAPPTRTATTATSAGNTTAVPPTNTTTATSAGNTTAAPLSDKVVPVSSTVTAAPGSTTTTPAATLAGSTAAVASTTTATSTSLSTSAWPTNVPPRKSDAATFSPFLPTPATVGTAITSSGFGTGITSSGFGTGNTSSGFGTGNTSSGFGTGKTSSGFGTGTTSSGFGTGTTSSGCGTGTISSGFGTGTTSSGCGTGTTSLGFGTGITSSGFGTGTTSSGFGTGTTSSGFGTGSTSSGFGTGTTCSGFGTGSTSSGFGTGTTCSGFGTGSTSSGFGTGTTSSRHGTGSTPSGCGSTGSTPFMFSTASAGTSTFQPFGTTTSTPSTVGTATKPSTLSPFSALFSGITLNTQSAPSLSCAPAQNNPFGLSYGTASHSGVSFSSTMSACTATVPSDAPASGHSKGTFYFTTPSTPIPPTTTSTAAPLSSSNALLSSSAAPLSSASVPLSSSTAPLSASTAPLSAAAAPLSSTSAPLSSSAAPLPSSAAPLPASAAPSSSSASASLSVPSAAAASSAVMAINSSSSSQTTAAASTTTLTPTATANKQGGINRKDASNTAHTQLAALTSTGDMKLYCSLDKKTLTVHRCILRQHSSVLRSMIPASVKHRHDKLTPADKDSTVASPVSANTHQQPCPSAQQEGVGNSKQGVSSVAETDAPSHTGGTVKQADEARHNTIIQKAPVVHLDDAQAQLDDSPNASPGSKLVTLTTPHTGGTIEDVGQAHHSLNSPITHMDGVHGAMPDAELLTTSHTDSAVEEAGAVQQRTIPEVRGYHQAALDGMVEQQAVSASDSDWTFAAYPPDDSSSGGSRTEASGSSDSSGDGLQAVSGPSDATTTSQAAGEATASEMLTKTTADGVEGREREDVVIMDTVVGAVVEHMLVPSADLHDEKPMFSKVAGSPIERITVSRSTSKEQDELEALGLLVASSTDQPEGKESSRSNSMGQVTGLNPDCVVRHVDVVVPIDEDVSVHSGHGRQKSSSNGGSSPVASQGEEGNDENVGRHGTGSSAESAAVSGQRSTAATGSATTAGDAEVMLTVDDSSEQWHAALAVMYPLDDDGGCDDLSAVHHIIQLIDKYDMEQVKLRLVQHWSARLNFERLIQAVDMDADMMKHVLAIVSLVCRESRGTARAHKVEKLVERLLDQHLRVFVDVMLDAAEAEVPVLSAAAWWVVGKWITHKVLKQEEK